VSDDLVKVKNFPDRMYAERARQSLDAEGIPSIIQSIDIGFLGAGGALGLPQERTSTSRWNLPSAPGNPERSLRRSVKRTKIGRCGSGPACGKSVVAKRSIASPRQKLVSFITYLEQ